MSVERTILDEALRRDLAAFVHFVFQIVAPGERFLPNWHIDAICKVLMDVASGACKRLIIEAPPRSSKSICASVAFVAYLLGHNPTYKMICASYSGELARHLSRACREVMRHPTYQRLFPATRISAEKDTESYFRTTKGGYRYSTSVGGSLTGIGAGLIIVDDALKPEEAWSAAARDALLNWFNMTLRMRLNQKTSDAIIIVAQRLHAEDLAGHLRALGGWTVLRIPAIAEVDEDIPLGGGRVHHRKAGDLLDMRRDDQTSLGEIKSASSVSFSAQYQQRPIPVEGEIVKFGWFNQYHTVPMPPYSRISQSWDTAIKVTGSADFSVCMTFAILKNDYYLLDIYRDKLDFPSLKDAVVRQAYQWRAEDILIEDQGAGSSLIQQLRRERSDGMPLPLGFQPVGDKVTRLATVSPLIEQGRVHLPRKAPWLAEFRDELLQFPGGRHDDQVDALSQFLVWADKRGRRTSFVQVRPMFSHR